MYFRQLFDHQSFTYTYLCADVGSKEAIIIDPVLEKVERDLALISELGFQLKYIFDTHVHADHVTGAGHLRSQTKAKSVVSQIAQVECVDIAAQEGDVFHFGPYGLKVISTPGHTDGCLSYVVSGDDINTYAFTGDTLLIRGCGRTDFQGGNSAQLFTSIRDKLFQLPDDTILCPGHDYRGHTRSSIGEEKRLNPRVGMHQSLETFQDIMANLNLADPKMMDVAVPANLGCGLKH